MIDPKDNINDDNKKDEDVFWEDFWDEWEEDDNEQDIDWFPAEEF